MKTMIRIMILSIVLPFFLTNLAGQNAFYDALYLSNTIKEIDRILDNENSNLSLKERYDKLLEELAGADFQKEQCSEISKVVYFNDNPWKDPIIFDKKEIIIELEILKRTKLLKLLTKAHAIGASSEERMIRSQFSPIGMMQATQIGDTIREPISGKFLSPAFQSNLIEGVSSIIAERFKEGITVLYINKFREDIKKTNVQKIIEPLFSKTLKLIMEEENIPFDFKTLKSDLKKAFASDLNTILVDMVAFIENSKDIKSDFALWKKISDLKNSNLFYALSIAVDAYSKLCNGYHPIDLLGYFDLKYKSKSQGEVEKNIYEFIHTINIIQQNLRSLDESKNDGSLANTWIRFDQLSNLIQTEKGIDYFLALLYWRNKDFFDHSKLFNSLAIEKLKNSKDKLDKFLSAYQVLVKIDEFGRKQNKNAEDVVSYLHSMHELSKQLLITLNSNEITQDPPEIEVAQYCLDIYESIYKKDYTKVISNVNEIIKLFEKEKKDDFLTKLLSYAEFIEGLAKAKDAEDLKNLISSVILPSESFLTKRTTRFSLTISAHPGIFVGRERFINVDDIAKKDGSLVATGAGTVNKITNSGIKTKKWGTITGFTAPLGLEFCWGTKNVNSKEFISSFGIFLSVIDPGAIVSYRLTNSDDDYEGMSDASFNFKQIFSPGASINLGFKNTPITFRVGIQYTPELRKIKEGDIILDERKSWRAFAGFSWDIPLISITPRFKK